MSRVLFCLITNYMKKRVNHSGQIQARNDDTITKILYLIYTVWHLATPFLVFFSFLDSTISGHVTQISDFLPYRKIKVTDFSEVGMILEGSDKFSQSYDHCKILCKLAFSHALTCLKSTNNIFFVTINISITLLSEWLHFYKKSWGKTNVQK